MWDAPCAYSGAIVCPVSVFSKMRTGFFRPWCSWQVSRWRKRRYPTGRGSREPVNTGWGSTAGYGRVFSTWQGCGGCRKGRWSIMSQRMRSPNESCSCKGSILFRCAPHGHQSAGAAGGDRLDSAAFSHCTPLSGGALPFFTLYHLYCVYPGFSLRDRVQCTGLSHGRRPVRRTGRTAAVGQCRCRCRVQSLAGHCGGAGGLSHGGGHPFPGGMVVSFFHAMAFSGKTIGDLPAGLSKKGIHGCALCPPFSLLQLHPCQSFQRVLQDWFYRLSGGIVHRFFAPYPCHVSFGWGKHQWPADLLPDGISPHYFSSYSYTSDQKTTDTASGWESRSVRGTCIQERQVNLERPRPISHIPWKQERRLSNEI